MPDFLPRPKYPDERRYQFIDNLTYYAGAHSIKAGIDINYVRENIINLFQGGGVYAYAQPQNASRSDCPIGASRLHADADRREHRTCGTTTRTCRRSTCAAAGFNGDVFFTTTDYNFFIQDTWRVSTQLTLNFGLRYEYQQLPQPGEAAVNGVVFTGNPHYPPTHELQPGQEQLGPARRRSRYDVSGAPHDGRPRADGASTTAAPATA